MSFAYFPPVPDAKALLWVPLVSLYLHPHRESGQTTGLCGNAPTSQLSLVTIPLISANHPPAVSILAESGSAASARVR